MTKIIDTSYPTASNFVDKSGEFINGIEVIKYVGRNASSQICYLCKCHCGKEFITSWNSLKMGTVISCGCFHSRGLRKDDEYRSRIGEVHNRLKILGYERIEKNGKSRGYFDCECQCENKTRVIVRTDQLLSGNTKSCGCLQKEFASNLMKNADKSNWKKSSRVYTKKVEFDNLELMSHVGETHNRLKIIGCVRKESGGRLRNFYTCECRCGTILDVRCEAVLKGTTKSCGCASREAAREVCIKRNTKHGLYGTAIYHIWKDMRSRCNDTASNRYYRYGNRGIKVCNEWNNSETGFLTFYNWAINNGYEEGLTIDRIDIDGNYEPSNCKWSSNQEQSWNKSNNVYITYEQRFDEIGKPPIRYTFPLSIWSEITGIPRSTLRYRLFNLRDNWTVEQALMTPVDCANNEFTKDNSYRILNIGEYINYNHPEKYENSIHD